MSQASKKKRNVVQKAADTTLDIAVGGTAMAIDKGEEALDKFVERGEKAIRKGVRSVQDTATSTAAEARKAATEADARPYEERTREELYELAAKRGIEGRSSMRKAELVAALRAKR